MDLASIGFKVDSSQAERGADSLDKMAIKAQKAEMAAMKLSTAFKTETAAADMATAAVMKGKNAIEAQQIAAMKNVQALEKMSNAQNKTAGSLKDLVSNIENAKNAFMAMIAAMGIVKLIQMADHFNQLQAKIKNALTAASQFPSVFQKIIDSSNRSGISIDAVAQAFVRLKPSAKNLGVGNDDLIKFNETFAKMGAIAGNTGTEVYNAMIQISQGIGSGRLQGQDLRAVLEDLPKVGRTIAASMGIPFEEFRKKASEGKVTAKEIFKAILDDSKNVEEQFKNLPLSVDRSMNQLQNSVNLFINGLNQSIEVTNGVSKMIQGLSGWINNLQGEFGAANTPISKLVALCLDLWDVTGVLIQAIGEEYTTFNDWFTTITGGLSATDAFINVLKGLVQILDFVATSALSATTAVHSLLVAEGGLAAMTVGNQAGVDKANSELEADSKKQKKIWDDYGARGAKRWIPQSKGSINMVLSHSGIPDEGPGSNYNPPGKKHKKTDAEKNAEKVKKLIEGLDAETSANERLYAAREKSESEYDTMKDRIDAENKIRQANVKISGEQKEALIQQIIKSEQLKKSVADLGEINKQNASNGDQKKMLDALKTGGEAAFEQMEKQVEIEKKLRDMRLDPASVNGIKMKTALEQDQTQKEDEKFEHLKKASELEIANQKRIQNALSEGLDKYQQTIDQIEIENKVLAQTKDLKSAEGQLLKANLEVEKESAKVSQAKLLTAQTNKQMEENKSLYAARAQGGKYNTYTGQVEFTAYEAQKRYYDASKQAFEDTHAWSGQAYEDRLREIQGMQQQGLEFDKMAQKQEYMISLGQQIGDAFSNAFSDMIFGAKSFKEALRDLATQLAKMAFQATIGNWFKKLGSGLFSGGSSILSGGHSTGGLTAIGDILKNANAHGNAFYGGNVVPFARGGVVGSPHTFPMSGGRTGLMGEAGHEGILPLTRTANGDLGVKAIGGGGGGGFVQYNSNFNISLEGGPSGDPKKDAEFIDKLGKKFNGQIKGMVTEQIRQQQRPGGILTKKAVM